MARPLLRWNQSRRRADRQLRPEDEQIVQVGSICGAAKQRPDVEEFLQRQQRGAVGVVQGVGIASPLARGERTIIPIGPSPPSPLIPSDEDHAVVAVRLGGS